MAFRSSVDMESDSDSDLATGAEPEKDVEKVSNFLVTTSIDFGASPAVKSERKFGPDPAVTALPIMPEPVITALPPVMLTSQRESYHGTSSSRDSWFSSKFSHYSDMILPEEQVGFRGSLWRIMSGIYGSEPTNPAMLSTLDEPTMVYPTGFRMILLLLSGALPYVVAVIDDTIIATIVPVLVNEFESPREIGWYASAYFLPLTVCMPLFGKSYSLWKIKWIFFGSLFTLLIGSIICATARSSSAFIAGRGIAGAGAAGIINGAMRIIGVSSSRKARTFLEATGALFMGVCTVTGPVLGGVISVHWGWRWAFWINVPIACLSLAVIAVIFPAEANQATFARLTFTQKIARLDPLGSTSLVVSLVCLITLLQNVSTSITFDVGDGFLAAVAAILLAFFIVHECLIRPDLALIPRHIIRHRVVWSCCCSLFLLFAGWMIFVFFLSLFFQTLLGYNAEESAFNILPYVVSVSVAAAITGVSVSFIHYYNPLFILGGICFAAGAGLILTINEHTDLGTRIGFEAIMGLGVGFLMLANVAPCQTMLDEKDHPVANGLTFFSSLLGATISLPVSNTLFNRTFLKLVTKLDIPPSISVLVLLDPTKIIANTPPDLLPAVLGALLDSIRKTFILGLCCAVMSAIGFLFVPWKPLLLMDIGQARRRRGGSASISTGPMSQFSIPIRL